MGIRRRQLKAVLYVGPAVVIIGATACPYVEELACKASYRNVARIFIFKFDEAALTAAITQGLPLLRRHLLEGFGPPKRGLALHVCWTWGNRVRRPPF